MAGLYDALTPPAQSVAPQPAQQQADPTAAFMGTPPTTPEEVETRKAGWRGVLERIDTDPKLQQALMAVGLKMMQPGGNLGTAGLAGMQVYNAAADAEKQEQRQRVLDQRAAGQDRRAAEAHRQNMEQGQLQTQQSRQNMEWAAKTKPLEIRRLEAEIAQMPLSNASKQLALQLQRLQLEQEPELARLKLEELQARIAAAKQSGAAATRETDQQRAISALMQDEMYAGMSDAQKRAAATREFYSTSRGVPGRMKLDDADQKAVDLYDAVMQDPAGMTARMVQMDPELSAEFQRGKRLAEAGSGMQPQRPSGSAAPKSAGPAPTPAQKSERRVITAEEIRRQLNQ